MSDLAVIIPSRSRPHNVAPIIEAWKQTRAFGVADLWWIVDADDAHVFDYQTEFAAGSSGSCQIRQRVIPQWRPLVPKLNDSAVMLRKEFGYRYLAFMGDDHLPRTPMWAQMLIEGHTRPGSGIVYGQDGFQDRRLPTWWSMDGRIIDKLGRMVPAPVQHLYCDNAVKTLGEKTDQLAYDERILIEHMHPVANKGTMDDQYARVNRRQQYDRDQAAFRGWVASGLDEDATILADIWR